MERSLIEKAFIELNSELKIKNMSGTIEVFGGAVMCLVHKSRMTTNDVDAVFEPKLEIYTAAKKVADKLGLPINWLNDGVKGFIPSTRKTTLYKTLSNLRIKVGTPDFMLASKCVAARGGTNDNADIKFLLKYLNIKSTKQAEDIILRYYPESQLMPKTSFNLLEILGK